MTGVRRGRTAGAGRLAGTALLGIVTVAGSAVLPVSPPAYAAAPPYQSAPAVVQLEQPAAAALAQVPDRTAAADPKPVNARPITRPPGGITNRLDPIREDQWQLDELHATAAWRLSTGRGVTVAVIDSGVDDSHPDLAGQVLPGLDLVAPDGVGKRDPVGHGTTVAALIAGRRDDERGVVGLAPDARILPVRVLDAENRYDDAMIVAKGVRWAVDSGARVINLSLGGSGNSPALAAALDYAFARDVVVVACTGNTSTSTDARVWYPAREPGVIAVAGLERNTNDLWSGSISGAETVLTAPASGLVGARPGGYWQVQGTSFAAPLVAASAALVRARWPEMPAGEVVNRLLSTAQDLGPAGRDDRFGFGRVDPVAALTADLPPVDGNPLDDNTSPGVVGFGPAPGLDGEQSDLNATQSNQLGMSTAQPSARLAARSATEPPSAPPERVWGAVTLLLALLTGATLMMRRFRRPPPARFRRPPPARRPASIRISGGR